MFDTFKTKTQHWQIFLENLSSSFAVLLIAVIFLLQPNETNLLQIFMSLSCSMLILEVIGLVNAIFHTYSFNSFKRKRSCKFMKLQRTSPDT